MSAREGTVIATPNGASVQAARLPNWEPRFASDQLYQAAMRVAGCEVQATANGWVAVSPAGKALFGKLYPRSQR